MIASLPETLPKHIREKCLKAKIAPMQGLKESLKAINFSIETNKAWEGNNKIKIYKNLQNTKVKNRSYSEYQSKKILNRYGVNIPQAILTLEKVKKITKHLSKITPEILMENMITDTIAELIIGIKIDNQFGPVIVIGAGGIYAELFRDTVTLLTPINKNQVLEAINNLKISKIINGFRGKGEGDMQELVSTIINISKFAEKNVNKITEVDINPLIVRKKGKGEIAVDALIYYSEEIR